MKNLSMTQALGIWADLVEAYHGVNGYGGDTAEIYAYRLNPYSPRMVVSGGDAEDVAAALGEQAANSLCDLLNEFCAMYECRAEVDGRAHWTAFRRPLVHRCHVKIIRLAELQRGKDSK